MFEETSCLVTLFLHECSVSGVSSNFLCNCTVVYAGDAAGCCRRRRSGNPTPVTRRAEQLGARSDQTAANGSIVIPEPSESTCWIPQWTLVVLFEAEMPRWAMPRLGPTPDSRWRMELKLTTTREAAAIQTHRAAQATTTAPKAPLYYM